MENHNIAVAGVAAVVKQFYAQRQPFRIYHGSTNSTRPSQHKKSNIVDTSTLNHVLHVNTEEKIVTTEPNVPMDKLVEATMSYGLIPPVVMEFPGITTGGGFSGTSGESSSFRYGFFERTALAVEIVLANGDIVNANPENDSDLFYGAASSWGTLGIVTLLKIRLVESKPYVRLTHYPVTSMKDALKRFEEFRESPKTDYLDGIMYAANHGVVCVGNLTSEGSSKLQHFTRSTDPWFYIHAERTIDASPNTATTEVIPLVEYLFRYDRGAFWVGKYAFQYFVTPFNRITRWALDKFMHTRTMYHALHRSGFSQKYIVQDVGVPWNSAAAFLEYVDVSFGHYPLWLCPLGQTGNIPQAAGTVSKEGDAEMWLNFGIWGPGPSDTAAFVAANRSLENKVRELGGRKWLYAHTYYTEEEFWQIYDREGYDKLRQRYHANHLPTIYDKVKVDLLADERKARETWAGWVGAVFWGIWPLSGVYGVLSAALGGDYLLKKEAVNLKGKTKTA